MGNDIFWLIKEEATSSSTENQQENRVRAQAIANRKVHSVNESMVNRYYHDTSYQCFNNNFAVFIRPIPNTLTHARLASLLKEYIEGVQFAFVYFQDHHSFERALNCGEIFINGASAQTRIKRSKNKPRTFGFPRRQ